MHICLTHKLTEFMKSGLVKVLERLFSIFWFHCFAPNFTHLVKFNANWIIISIHMLKYQRQTWIGTFCLVRRLFSIEALLHESISGFMVSGLNCKPFYSCCNSEFCKNFLSSSQPRCSGRMNNLPDWKSLLRPKVWAMRYVM